MFNFEHTVYFYEFAAMLLMLLLVIWYFATCIRKLNRIGDRDLISQLIPYSSPRKKIIKTILFLTAFSSLILALCNLQTGSKLTEVKREGADIIVCLDV